MKIKTSERVAMIGTTGSGKTELARFFLRLMNRVIVLDPKHTFHLDGYKTGWALPFLGGGVRMVVRPNRGDDSRMADLLWKAYREQNVTIYVDELSTLADLYPESTDALADFARTGREKHVSVWSVMQRPKWVPLIFLTESETFFVFNLRSGDDRKYVSNFAGDEVIEQIPLRQFWYAPVNQKAQLMRLDKDAQKLYNVERMSDEQDF